MLFLEIADSAVLLCERTEVFFHKSRDGGIPLGGHHAGPAVSFIVDCNSDIFHFFTISHIHSLKTDFSSATNDSYQKPLAFGF